MSTDPGALSERVRQEAATVLGHLTLVESAVSNAGGGMTGLPRFARGIIMAAIEREVSRNTGKSIDAWVEILRALSESLRRVDAVASRAGSTGRVDDADRQELRDAVALLKSDEPLFERLAAFLDRAPSLLQRIPAGRLWNARRDSILSTLESQSHAVHGARAVMPSLARDLALLADV